jgi:hypothetical protein
MKKFVFAAVAVVLVACATIFTFADADSLAGGFQLQGGSCPAGEFWLNGNCIK